MEGQQITVNPLPQLPHPSALAQPAGPAAFLVQELQSTYAQLAQLRQAVLASPSSYTLDPPGPSSLPPLPPVPLPPTTFRKPSVRASQSNTPRPQSRPAIHPSSPFANARTADDCIEGLRGADCSAQSRYGSSAIWVDTKDMGAWITLRPRGTGSSPKMRNIRLFTGAEGERPIHAQSSSQSHRALSKHLSDLQLDLPELLYRLVALPGLLSAPCHYCGLRMKVPDGLPLANTGYIPKEVRDIAEKATSDSETKTDETKPEPDRGQWVAWHLSCEPV